MVRCDFCTGDAVVLDKEGFVYCYTCAEEDILHDPFITEKKEFIHVIAKARCIFENQIVCYDRPRRSLLEEQFQEKVYEFEKIFDSSYYVPTVVEFLTA